jgi:hypothetical protein
MAENDIEFFNSGDSSPVLSSSLGHPLFLQHSDHPGLLLVSKRLNGENYNSWHCAMKISLSTKNKTGFITGKSKNPMRLQILKSMPFASRCNDMAFMDIINSLEQELVDSVLSCNTCDSIFNSYFIKKNV